VKINSLTYELSILIEYMLFTIAIVSCIVFIFNIPFGYWRANVKKFSFQWILAIHIPVPIVIFLRIRSEIGFIWYSYIILIFAFFLGQKIGEIILKKSKKQNKNVSSCLVMNLLRACCL
jgi:low affinity Fe/Cu permease